MTSHANLLRRLDEAALEVSDYAGSEAARAGVALIDALEAMYLQDLCSVGADRLPFLQGCVAQLQELRGVMTAAVKTNGRL